MTEPIFSQPLARSRLSEEIEAVLVTGIIKGRLRAGEKLPTERELARDLEVNRSTVRAALSKLESLDLVEIRHGDGVYVKNFLESGNLDLIRTLIHLDETRRGDIIPALLRLRTVIGPEIAHNAARNRTQDHLAALEEVVRKDDDVSVLEKDIRVHHVIALASGNMPYLILLNFFNKIFREYGHLYFDVPENAKRSQRFHEEIYEAMRKGRAGTAKRVMKEVLEYAELEVARRIGIMKG